MIKIKDSGLGDIESISLIILITLVVLCGN
jgi:hypothetical protein